MTKLRGTTSNPVTKADVPDPSIIRVGDAYYMISTTMYFTPVAPIMKSYDLVNWQIISYLTCIIEDAPNFNLETEDTAIIGDYGRGQWASSLRFFDGYFWAMFSNNTTAKSYFFSTSDPENEPWIRWEIDRQFYDPSIFFDETTDRMFIIHSYGDIRLTEMEKDLRAVKAGGVDGIIFSQSDAQGGTALEGYHVYWLNGYYYIFTISWGPGRRSVICCRSETIEGPYESRVVLNRGLGDRNEGVAQGGIIQTSDGNWYGLFFQDRGAVGRVPVLVPMRWGEDNWPVFGDENGNIPDEFEINLAVSFEQNLYVSDDFNEPTLPFAWQWNHNPDNRFWSLTERAGFLRLTTGRVDRTIFHARNTLTMRTFEPACHGTIALEPVNMKDGDIAGLWAMGSVGGFVGIEKENGEKFIVMKTSDYLRNNNILNVDITERERVPFTGNRIYLRLDFQFRTPVVSTESAAFAYSLDGENWQNIGTAPNIRWDMSLFTGYRFGLFNYAAKEAGGYVDFDYFHISGI